jgi:hypothetical protein
MKKILTLLAATISFSPGYGQIELSVSGGLLTNRTPWVDGNSSTYTQSPMLSGYTSLKLFTHVHNNWQVGIGIDVATIKSSLIVEVPGPQPKLYQGSFQIGDPNIPFYLMLNRTIRAPKGYAYAGMNAGITFITGASNTRITHHGIAPTEKQGFQAGLQAGYTYQLIKRLAANAELGARYLTTAIPGAKPNVDNTYDVWYFPIALGLRYWL